VSDEKTEQVQAPPPEAVDRLKRERDEAKATLDTAAKELAMTRHTKAVYEALKNVEVDGKRLPDPFALADRIASQVPMDAADLGSAAMELVNGLRVLLPSATTTPAAPMSGLPSGPNPGAEGESTETGPFRVGSKEYLAFVEREGMAAANQAIVDGRFYFSAENEAAQATARAL
jgi:hypothetical protein